MTTGPPSVRPPGRASRVEDGNAFITGGPFVAIKEPRAGCVVFIEDDLNTAIEIAARIPAAQMGGAVEVREPPSTCAKTARIFGGCSA